MVWDEMRQFAFDPLVTIGAHTTGHYALSKLDSVTARRQMAVNIARIEAELARACHNCSFPCGDELACGPREF
jgi:peptidoglycan/xylan/chitin deacetylase (PgdA/CDA1 family)